MEVKSELLNKLETLFEILGRIITYEEGTDLNQYCTKRNSPINQNPFEFVKEISNQIENIITRGFLQIHGK